MEAIQTVYNGYKFRSRLEARYAVMFDSMGLTWSYEPEGFILFDGTWYLPDFYIKEIDSYIEVKPYYEKDTHSKLLEKWSISSYKRLIILDSTYMEYGSPDAINYTYEDSYCIGCECKKKRNDFCDFIEKCFTKKENRIHFSKREPQISECFPFFNDDGYIRIYYALEAPDVAKYYADLIREHIDNAKKARFEHGENPKEIIK